MTGMDGQLIHEYLARLGAVVADPGPRLLEELQERHLMTVPFENIDFHLGERIRLGRAAVEKVARRNRGGTCRELNGVAFPALLTALGYRVSLLGSRVFVAGRATFPLAHTVIRVDCPRPWLVDVGIGKDGPRRPLRLDDRGPQHDQNGMYRFVDRPDGEVDLLRDGVPVVRIEPRPREVDDFRPVLWWFETSPDSPFRTDLFCTRTTPLGRITLRGNVLTRTEDDTRETTVLGDDAGIARAYREHFDITLDRLPPIPVRAAG
jgi:N-hydroxyarylamine O-acetyltransferase